MIGYEMTNRKTKKFLIHKKRFHGLFLGGWGDGRLINDHARFSGPFKGKRVYFQVG